MGIFDKLRGKDTPPAAAPAPAAPAEPKELSLLKDGMLVLHWAALGDGVQQEEEYNIIRDYIRERTQAAGPKDADVETLIAWLKPLRPTQEQLREAIRHVVDGSPHGQMVRRYAQALIKSDDNVDVGEMKVMQQMSKFFAEAEAQLS